MIWRLEVMAVALRVAVRLDAVAARIADRSRFGGPGPLHGDILEKTELEKTLRFILNTLLEIEDPHGC